MKSNLFLCQFFTEGVTEDQKRKQKEHSKSSLENLLLKKGENFSSSAAADMEVKTKRKK